MHVQPALIAGVSPHAFRSGEPAQIMGVVFVRPEGSEHPRPCFAVFFPDGETDYIPVADIENYRFLTIPQAAQVGLDPLGVEPR